MDEKYYNEAINAINYAQTLAPTDAKVAYNAGLLYGQAGDTTKAKVSLEKSIILKANYKEPRYALSVYLIGEAKEEKDEEKKQKLLREAQENLSYILKNISPNDKQTMDLLKSIQ